MKDKKGVALSGRETARSCPIWFNLNIKEFVYLIAKYKIIYQI